ncbi:hypothetical protein [Rhizobium sp. TRM95796]|uniref:hypothetical protein n=1 Tax=Rhizobium sp. TRM95796 TaxID=2979862 RepID=UPI0021E84D9D|nr:hypothetical protein [Rhizobium sp. TRM95796]MCV3769104.1 hypothetical protein [Rhizobium sp. TRM95796]
MDYNAIQTDELGRALSNLKRNGHNVRPLRNRLGYYMIDDSVKDAETLIREATAH